MYNFDLRPLFRLAMGIIIFVCVIAGILTTMVIRARVYGIKTTTKPKITWELKADGQKVDTVWIYKFN